MQRRITWTILLLIVSFAVAILAGSYYFRFTTSKKIPNNQQQVKKDFLDFSIQKKKLPLINKEVSFIAVGDISYSRAVGRKVQKQKDINYPFLKIQDYLKSADLVFGNLETPITQGREISDFEMVFRSDPGTEQALKNAGFSILSLANNHTPNFGEQGLMDTFKYLENANIKYVGAGKDKQQTNQPVYIDVKGIKFAFLAYNDPDVAPPSYEASDIRAGTAFMRIDKMTEAVKTAKEKADFVIVSMHSGIEYVDKPDDSQVNIAHNAIDAGADLIIGHHSHVVQTMEQYKGKYIFYSLGNFVFDQPQSQETKDGLTIKVYFTKDKINKIYILPIVMESFAQPKMAEEGEADKILQRLKFSLARNDAYFWNDSIDSFDKTSMVALYDGSQIDGGLVSKIEKKDIDGDLIEETYALENGQLTITRNLKILWQSQSDWWIDDFVIADSNNDGVPDINLSVWRPGNFGTSKPFWIKENDMSIKNHFFVFDLVGDKMKPIWQSSNLGVPNCGFTFADIDGDGNNDLVTIEGDYLQMPECKGNYFAVWKWNGWGFSNEWRSGLGKFSNLEIEKIDRRNYIVADSL